VVREKSDPMTEHVHGGEGGGAYRAADASPAQESFPHRGALDRWFPYLACTISGLLGGPVFSHWISGLSWNQQGPNPIPAFNFGSWILAWVALVPYFMVLLARREQSWLRPTFIFGTLWHLGSLLWLATLVPFNPFIPLGVILLALGLTCFLFLFAWVARGFVSHTKPYLWPAVLATTWVGVEFLRTVGAFAFPWNFLGHSQALGNAWACQIADIAGVAGLSWTIAYTNALIATIFVVIRETRPIKPSPKFILRELAIPFAFGVVLLLLQFALYPTYVYSKLEALPARADAKRVAVLQPNIPQFEKMRFYTAPDVDTANRLDAEMTLRTLDLVGQACANSTAPLELLVMPESSFNSTYFVYDTALHRELEGLSRACQASIVFGADRREAENQYQLRLAHPFSGASFCELPTLDVCAAADGTTYPCERGPMTTSVAAFYVTPQDGLTTRVYDKIHLVPFGETAPVLDKIPYFQEWVLMVGSYARGTEYTLFPLGTARFGVMICFESAFADLARAYAQRGADLLCIITNDAWYDRRHLSNGFDFWRTDEPSAANSLIALYSAAVRKLYLWIAPDALFDRGPIQHLAHAVLRAIETRRMVLRSANTGISATVDPTGTVRRWLPWATRGILYDEVIPPLQRTTFYTRFGDWLGWFCVGVLAIGVGRNFRERFRRRPSRSR
jgi:apolipoprotein N-acyltransferase